MSTGDNNRTLKIYEFAKKIGITSPGNIYAGLKHCSLNRFFDGFFSEKYVYISDKRYHKAKEFKKYFSDIIRYKRLIKDLDFKSIELIDRYRQSIDYTLENYDLCVPSELLSISNNPQNKKIKKNIKSYIKNFSIPKHLFPEVRFYKHGINYIPNIFDYTNGKDIIDCGAFIGDSALMFNKELKIGKIFCCEPDSQNFNILNDVIKNNNMKNKIYPLNVGVGSKKCKLHFDSGKIGGSCVDNNGSSIIDVDTIDNLVIDNHINPGLIKWDIEGAEYDSILGAEYTIKKFKPDLLISIYHTAKDFFEIKPLLETWNLGYKFKVIHCTEKTSTTEIMLLAYIE